MLERKYKSNVIIVNTKSNFKSHLVKCQTIMDDVGFEELVLKAMGKATTRASNLALQLNSNNHNTFEISPSTYSVERREFKHRKVIRGAQKDKFDPDDVEVDKKKVVYIPAIQIIVRKNELELEKTRSAKRLLESQPKH